MATFVALKDWTDGSDVVVNADQIVTIRPAAKAAEGSTIFFAQSSIAVKETPQEIAKKLASKNLLKDLGGGVGRGTTLKPLPR
jgi:hypothetical protein